MLYTAACQSESLWAGLLILSQRWWWRRRQGAAVVQLYSGVQTVLRFGMEYYFW